MSLRNRELLNLVVVGMLTALGFASVFIARQAVVSTGSLAYAAFFFALYLTAHLIARWTVPYADPYLLPMAGLLTAVGVTEIYRLEPKYAFRQGFWVIAALALFAVVLVTLRRDIAKAQSDGRSGDDLVTAVTAELKDTYGNWGFFNYFIKPDITFTAAELKGTKRIPVPAKD